jgi:hypothetical protein
MNIDVQAGISAEAEQDKTIPGLAKLVRAKKVSIDSLAPSKQEAIRRHLAGSMTPQQFHAQQNAERMKFFRELKAQGHTGLSASQRDHDFIFDKILTTVDSGAKPAVKPLLREYAAQQGYAPEWVERVAAKNQPRKTAKSLKAHRQHPVIQDLRDGQMLTQTHQSMLKNATYSGLAELLFSGSQSTREKQDMRARLLALEAKLAAVEAVAERANARLNVIDAGLDWKEKARSVLGAEPGISKRELARRVGQSEGSIRKYWAHLADHQGCDAQGRP